MRLYSVGGLRAMRLLAASAAIMAAALAGGCSISMPIGGIWSASSPSSDATGAIGKPDSLSPTLTSADDSEVAKAIAAALDPEGPGARVTWRSVASGHHGAIVPVADPFADGGKTCRAFIATLATGGGGIGQSLQGSACRTDGGPWALQAVKPFAGG
ncbi:MAG: hypothetical protein KGI57_07650 [Hyphomicrobiales bacterium]|nr:hypothetical protein [Hyphomicrobiales bacterium]